MIAATFTAGNAGTGCGGSAFFAEATAPSAGDVVVAVEDADTGGGDDEFDISSTVFLSKDGVCFQS